MFLQSLFAFWPPFDHYCAVAPQNAEKACCDNQQQAFSCFGRNCAEPTKFTFQRQSTLPCRSSPTPDAGGSNPFRRTKKSPCNVVCKVIFCLLYFRFKSASAAYHRLRRCTGLVGFSCFAADLRLFLLDGFPHWWKLFFYRPRENPLSVSAISFHASLCSQLFAGSSNHPMLSAG